MKKINIRLSFFLVFALSLVVVGTAFASFPDTTGHKYEEAIKFVKAQGIVSGYPDGTYQPEKTINRAELTKIIIEAVYPGRATGSKCFPDVNDEWFAKYVCYAKDKGIIGGYPDGSFKPNNEINWVEALKITLEAFDADLRPNSGEWYQSYLNYVEKADVAPSDIAGNTSILKRGQMAELIFRLKELMRRIDSAKAKLTELEEKGADIKIGPCLGQIDIDWIADVAHYPRSMVDNELKNQCQEWRDKKVSNFLEIEPDGTFIQVGHQDID